MRVTENPLYYPEKSGLRILEQIETGESYTFDSFIIFAKDADNTLYYDTDSGCSCPIPFDIYGGGRELTPIDRNNLESFYKALESHYRISKVEVANAKQVVKDYFMEYKKKSNEIIQERH